jgi:putative nucleotidyltransferase with HDIG domain
MSESTIKSEEPWALRLVPPFPAIANRVMRLVNTAEPDLYQIGEAINLDPIFTTEILRDANSPLYGAAREITNVKQAVPRLGLDRVKAVAALIAVRAMLKPAVRLETLRRCWIHSLVAAILTEEGARACGIPPDTAYTAGLLHNLGSLGLMAAYPDEYRRMLDVSSEFNFDLLQAERDIFEIDHCAAGARLAQKWGFPDQIAAAIATHHDEPNSENRSISALVQISWRLADTLGYQAYVTDRIWTYEELVARVPGATRTWLGGGIDGAKQEISARLDSFEL